jgi:hypothetical protein
VPFSEMAKKQSVEHLQRHDYIKVKIVYHQPDKTLSTVM